MLDGIPNNVNLENNPKLQRALQRWNPNFLDWWREMVLQVTSLVFIISY